MFILNFAINYILVFAIFLGRKTHPLDLSHVTWVLEDVWTRCSFRASDHFAI